MQILDQQQVDFVVVQGVSADQDRHPILKIIITSNINVVYSIIIFFFDLDRNIHYIHIGCKNIYEIRA